MNCELFRVAEGQERIPYLGMMLVLLGIAVSFGSLAGAGDFTATPGVALVQRVVSALRRA
jgi:hypothetical protein